MMEVITGTLITLRLMIIWNLLGDHCCWKGQELHSIFDRKDTAGSNMEEEVVNSKMEEEEVDGSKLKEEVVDQIIKGSVIQKTVRICTIAPSFEFKDSII